VQFGDDLGGGLAGLVDGADRKTDSSDFGVAAPAIAFADGGEVVRDAVGLPGIGTHADLRAEGGGGNRNSVDVFREQVVGNELVVAFDAVGDEVEEDDFAVGVGALADEVDVAQVALVEKSFRSPGVR